MNRIVLAVSVLALSTLACGQYTSTPTPPAPTASPVPLTATAAPTATAEATATGEGVIIAIVRQPVVTVRLTAAGDPTGDYITAGQEVVILEIVTDDQGGEWARIADPAGFVWAGCLLGVNSKGCEAR
jgi:hypothetical protein